MIQNARVLQEDFIPLEVPHRNTELNELHRALRPIEEEEPGENTVFISGPSGVGKTAVTRHMLEDIRTNVLDVNTQYVNCWQDYSRFEVLYEVLSGFSSTVDIHRRSTPTDELLNRVENYDGPPYVVVLDEFDQLEDESVLYDLYSVPEISMALITNDLVEELTLLDDRIVSRLRGSRKIDMEKYSIDALVDILQKRVEEGLNGDPVDKFELEQIADLAAGDARQALAILRLAVREAAMRNLDEIHAEVIEEVAPEAREEVRDDILDQLKDHQWILYNILDKHGRLDPSELYDLYHEQVENPKTDRTVRNYLQKLVHYKLIVAKGKKRGRTYRVRNSE